MSNAAKELFRKYDGSTFFMSRDGVEEEYLSYRVPAKLEKEWLEEITNEKLAALNETGNWWTVYFLIHHGDFRFLSELTSTKASGVFWERCAFYEHLTEYVSAFRSLSPVAKANAVKHILEGSAALQKVARSEKSIKRAQEIEFDAKALLSS